MKRNFFKHFSYYLSLILIFTIGLFATLFAAPYLKLQVMIIVGTILFYVGWGILHHKINHELTSKIAIEYILIGILGLSVVFFIFMGGIGI